MIAPITTNLGYQVVPLGLLYLASYLEREGHKVKFTDALIEGINTVRKLDDRFMQIGLTKKELSNTIKCFKPDLVGISCTFTAFKEASFNVAEIVKEIDRNIPVVFGGAHTSASPLEVVKNKHVDLAIFGEGEQTIAEIADRIEKGKRLDNIKGSAIKGKLNPPRELFKDLDTIPFPARHLAPMKKYFASQKTTYPYCLRYPILTMVTSRGCPGKCIFCSVHTIWGRTWRGRSPSNVVDEIEEGIEKYGIRELNITDDNVSLNRKRLIEICDEIKKRGLDITWQTPNGIAIWNLDREVLKKMRNTGYYRAKFGLETGSKKMQDYIGKRVDFDKARQVIRDCNRLGIFTASSFIIGFPNETREDILKTIEFAKSTHLDFARFLIAQPYAGTALFDEFVERGLIDENAQQSSAYYSTYNTEHLSAKELNELREKAHKEFALSRFKIYLNPYTFFTELLPKILYFESSSGMVLRVLRVVSGKRNK